MAQNQFDHLVEPAANFQKPLASTSSIPFLFPNPPCKAQISIALMSWDEERNACCYLFCILSKSGLPAGRNAISFSQSEFPQVISLMRQVVLEHKKLLKSESSSNWNRWRMARRQQRLWIGSLCKVVLYRQRRAYGESFWLG